MIELRQDRVRLDAEVSAKIRAFRLSINRRLLAWSYAFFVGYH